MPNLKELVSQYGSPDILIDSFNKQDKRYAIWGFEEVLQIKNSGLYLNNQLIKDDWDKAFQSTINKWKKESKNQKVACAGFVSYEFKKYLYQHIRFNNNLNNSFPYLWFCKPTKIREYDLTQSDYNVESIKLNLNKDIMSLTNYNSKISHIKNYLKNGDVYQINFTDKKKFDLDKLNPFNLYQILRNTAKPQEGFFMQTDEFDILSLSPESFLKIKDGIIETAPIKGTRPSSKNQNINSKMKLELKNSTKDKAEHLMIVDLMRNDLGKICELKSIKVDELYSIKTFETIHHMVTKIKGKLKHGINELEIFTALFPGGSITGAPKESAMKMIDKLEEEPRKIYTGSAGYISPNGNMNFNICIRTLLRNNNQYEYGVGGGIVWDSIAEEEWNEAQQKSKILEPLL
tara:strand:+ start:7173 stop:8381 length:1209 start_codon:yes stop_codon:yes gene_type:complete